MQRRGWRSAWQKDFEQGENTVERMLRYLWRVRNMPTSGISNSVADKTYIRPSVEPHGEPTSRVQGGPEHYSNQEGKGSDGGIENGM